MHVSAPSRFSFVHDWNDGLDDGEAEGLADGLIEGLALSDRNGLALKDRDGLLDGELVGR